MSAEAEIQTTIVKYAQSRGCIALKVNIGSQRGWPDYLFINPKGVHFWIEFKSPGKKPSKLQTHRMKELSLRDVDVWYCDDIDQGLEIVNYMVSP
jgi:hypothetical protein